MRVFHLINTLSAGGAELHLLTLVRLQRAAGFDVTVACLREHVRGSRSLASDFEALGVPVVRLAGQRRLGLRFLPALVAALRRTQPEVLHSHLPRADFAALLARRAVRVPVWVSSVHDVYSRSWSGRWSLPLFDRVWRAPDRVVAISGGVRDWLVRRGLPADRITVIHYGIRPGTFARPTADLRAAWGLAGRPVVGSIGRLEPRKGHDLLIRAMAVVRRARPDAVLLIAGHDPWGYRPALERMIRNLRLADAVRLVGFQSDIPSFIGALDVFAFASRSEGFGQVLLEVMDAGRPVVTGRLAPMIEIVEDGVTGLLVTPADPDAYARAIVALLADPARRDAMGRAGRARVAAAFSDERMAARTADLYRECLAARVVGAASPTGDPRR